MKKIIVIVLSVITVAFVAQGILRSIELAEKQVPTIPELQADEGIPVETTQVTRRSVTTGRVYTGTIRGIEQADATAKTLERLESVKVRIGERVTRGQVVATLSPDNPAAGLRQAELALELAERELKRRKALYTDGAISQQELDFAEHDVKIAESTITSIRELLNVRAPIDGYVTRIYQETGETVDAGEVVLEIARLNPVELEIQVGESDIHSVTQGQKARVQQRQDNSQSFEGSVSRIELSGSPVRREFNVRIRVPNANGALRPGMFATASLVTGEEADALLLPSDAVLDEDTAPYVYAVAADGNHAQKRSVTLGLEVDDQVVITEGVQDGERIILTGKTRLSDGDKIIIVE
jgi:membrane fusion protein, multidrug efflux system